MTGALESTPRRGFLVRVSLAIVVILSSLAALYWFRWSQDPERNEREVRAEAPPDYRVGLPTMMPRGRARRLRVVGPTSEVPEASAPVLSISSAGRIEVVRGVSVEQIGRAGPSAGSGDAAGAEFEFEEAAILVPEGRLQALGPEARAALLEVWSILGGQAQVPPIAVGVGLEDPEELERLRPWLR
ncbi:MAG: hypothetical protein AAF196_08390 [Planctomycetota bacterium]